MLASASAVRKDIGRSMAGVEQTEEVGFIETNIGRAPAYTSDCAHGISRRARCKAADTPKALINLETRPKTDDGEAVLACICGDSTLVTSAIYLARMSRLRPLPTGFVPPCLLQALKPQPVVNAVKALNERRERRAAQALSEDLLREYGTGVSALC
jgi:hypothetical protein